MDVLEAVVKVAVKHGFGEGPKSGTVFSLQVITRIVRSTFGN